jgi:alpha-L-rhamnosidase
MAPTSAWGYNWANGPFLDMVLFKLPFTIYKEMGDRRAIDKVYPYVKRYLPYVESFQREDGTLEAFGLGDWRPPENIGDPPLITNGFSDTCCYYQILCYAEQMAKMTADEELAIYCRGKADEVKEAAHKKYIHGDVVDNDSQGSLAAVLYFGLVEGDAADAIAKKLADSVIKDNYLIKVGIIGLISLFNALYDYGYADVAYKMINQYEYPSLGYWMRQGATTIWESWLGAASRCHQMISHPVEWIIRNVGGLQNKGIAYDKCLFKPYFFDENCSAECSTVTPRGEISIRWEKCGRLFTADILIPEGCDALLELPNTEAVKVVTGGYSKEL